MFGEKQKYKFDPNSRILNEYNPVDKKKLYLPVDFERNDIHFYENQWSEGKWYFGTFFEIGLYYPEAIVKFIVTYYMPELYAAMEKTDIMDYGLIDLNKPTAEPNWVNKDVNIKEYVLNKLTDINPMKSGKMDMVKLNKITAELNESIDTFNKFTAKRGNNVFTYMGKDQNKQPDLAMIKKLITEDPEQLELRNTVGQTPIMRALYISELEIVKYLIDAGADLSDYENILNYTIKSGNKGVFEFMYKKLAENHDEETLDTTIMDILENKYPAKLKRYTKLLDAVKATA